MTTETSIYEYAKNGLIEAPDNVAIQYYGGCLTYRELFDRIDYVADHLYELGVRQGTVVTIHLPNCPQAVMSIYAVAKLGGICNIVHPLVPNEGLKKNLDFTESNFLITYKQECCELTNNSVFVDISYHMCGFNRILYRLKNRQNRVGFLTFEDMEKLSCNEAPTIQQRDLANNCAVYLHSSGTTGEPKTVMHSHAAINRSVANAVDFYKLRTRTDEIVLSVLPLFHGMGLAHVMHISLSGGAQLLQMATWDTKYAAKLVDKHEATLIVGVPKMFQSLLNCKEFSGKSLRHCFVAGDNVTPELKTEFNHRVNKKHCIYEAYGMTEAVVGVCSCSAEHDNVFSCGFPVSNCMLRVIDKSGNLQAVGTGALVVNINTFMLGYLKDPVASKEAFFEKDGICWLKTGDIGRIDENGYVFFIDRIKNVLIHNGYNVYPLEIEKLSRTLTSIIDICVVGKQSNNTDQIYAFVECRAGVSKETVLDDLKNLWDSQLPRYAVPQKTVFVDHFPRNLMGKVIREEVGKELESGMGN